jgi:hypothetical protein
VHAVRRDGDEDEVKVLQALACNHQWSSWNVISTKIVVRYCLKCGATQEKRR